MGVTYFFDFAGFILNWIYGKDIVWKYFVFNNIANALQGLLIFTALICKKSMLDKVKRFMVEQRKSEFREYQLQTPNSNKCSKQSSSSMSKSGSDLRRSGGGHEYSGNHTTLNDQHGVTDNANDFNQTSSKLANILQEDIPLSLSSQTVLILKVSAQVNDVK